MHCTAVAKANFGFGGVNVDIHALCGAVKEQHVSREACVVQDICIGGSNGVIDHFVTHETLIDVSVLCVCTSAGDVRWANHADQLQFPHRLVDPNCVLWQVFAEYILDARLPIRHRVEGGGFIVVAEAEGAVGIGQSGAREMFNTMAQFSAIGFEKFASRGGVVI